MSHCRNKSARKSQFTDWRDQARAELEETANQLLAELSDGEGRVYTERQLARKMQLEAERMPEVEETASPSIVVDHILREHTKLLISSAKLNKLQAAVLTIALSGLRVVDIAIEYDIPYWLVDSTLRQAQIKLKNKHSPYDGLYEVYWSEVHRYVYRVPSKSREGGKMT